MSMRDFGVGRTKRSAVPAGVWQLPERRSAWSGLQIQLLRDVNGFLNVFQLSHNREGHDHEQRP